MKDFASHFNTEIENFDTQGNKILFFIELVTPSRKKIIYRLNSEKLFFPVDIFHNQNRLLESVSDAGSHDIKILPRSFENRIVEIFIKIRNCVGGTNMRG